MAYNHKRKSTPIPVIEVPNWPHIIDKLRMEGHSMTAVANACHCSRERLYGIWNNSMEPSWVAGQALIHLYSFYQ